MTDALFVLSRFNSVLENMKICRLLFFIAILQFFLSPVFSQPVYEFRGVWIATVDNIDWPTRGMTNVAEQKAEFIRQLDMHKRNGMNAVIVQVRPAADAFYPSQ